MELYPSFSGLENHTLGGRKDEENEKNDVIAAGSFYDRRIMRLRVIKPASRFNRGEFICRDYGCRIRGFGG